MNEHDLFSIKKFSEITGITQAALRHYDSAELFQPIMRNAKGYRFYSVRQAVAINFINVLKSVNVPMREISEIKKNKSPEKMLGLLRKQAFKLNQELYRLQQAYGIIHTYCEMIQEGLNAREDAISVCWIEAVPIELGPSNDFSSGYFYESFFGFLEQMIDSKVDPAYPAGGFYKNMTDFANTPGKPSQYFSYVPSGKDKKEAGRYLVAYTRGYYGDLGDAPDRMLAYAHENELAFTGPVYEMYLHDEITIDDCDRYLIQISVPIENANKTNN